MRTLLPQAASAAAQVRKCGYTCRQTHTLVQREMRLMTCLSLTRSLVPSREEATKQQICLESLCRQTDKRQQQEGTYRAVSGRETESDREDQQPLTDAVSPILFAEAVCFPNREKPLCFPLILCAHTHAREQEPDHASMHHEAFSLALIHLSICSLALTLSHGRERERQIRV